MRLAYGTVQRRATLDHLITVLAGRPVDRLDPAVVAALRLGLFQLLLLDGVADHAAVDQSVELAKAAGRGGHTLVNAVLRRATREGAGLLAQLNDATPGAAALAALPSRVDRADVVGRARSRRRPARCWRRTTRRPRRRCA